MPSDIRNFFGGGGSSQKSPTQSQSPKKADTAKSKPKTTKSSKRRVVDDDSDEENVQVLPTRTTPRKQAPPKQTSPKFTATTATAYFNKPKDQTNKPQTSKSSVEKTTVKHSSPEATKPKRASRNKVEQYHDYDDMDIDNDDNIHAAAYKKNRDDDYDDGSNSEDLPVKSKIPTKSSKRKVSDEDDEEEFVIDDEKPKGRKTTTGRKRKSNDANTKKSSPKKAKKVDVEDSADIKAILDDIPLVKPPTPPPRDKDGKYKFNHRAQAAAPANQGSRSIPEGAENCLVGLSFVFTGVLDSLDRDTGVNLVKRYGGKVQSAPTKKTSYVVLGKDAGPSKLNIIRQHGLKTIDEDGLFKLISALPADGGSGAAATTAKEKQEKEQQKALEQAQKEELEEKKAIKAQQQQQQKQQQQQQQQATKNNSTSISTPKSKTIANSDNKLWTVKYAPSTMDQIVGNKIQVTRLCEWLRGFRKSARLNFKLAGKDGMGVYRAVMIHGPPGIGKTTAAHLAAKLEGYDIVESNASDSRSKRMVEDGLKGVLGTTSLLGYFAADGKTVQDSKKKLVLIMDEVDGMSAGDRGGVGAMAAICKKSQIPIILICNERKLPKMKPFDMVTFDLPFRRPTTDQIRSRIMTIAYREELKIPASALNALIEGTGADIRQVVNMLSTVKLDEIDLDFSKGKEMSKAWEKHVILKPWDINGKILGGGLFDKTSKSTLNDKIELYFNDHEFSYLMLQENYLKTQPILAQNYSGRDRGLKLLDLASKASESISDGDLVDRMIHGTQQHWSLMPTHAIFSFVRPASYVAGSLGYSSTQFTTWLGQNSKQNKLSRMIKEIQGHMRLRCSADRHEVRQQYIPMFWDRLPRQLEKNGNDAIKGIIDLMDSYFLTKDDYDAISELGIGYMAENKIKIDSKVKGAFTRTYNQQSHPLPFMKASEVFAPKKAAKEKPDLEEAIDEEDDEEAFEPNKQNEDQENDLTKDKYIKAPKKKAAPKAASKGKKRAVDDDDDDDDLAGESDVKKSKSSKGKGRGKK